MRELLQNMRYESWFQLLQETITSKTCSHCMIISTFFFYKCLLRIFSKVALSQTYKKTDISDVFTLSIKYQKGEITHFAKSTLYKCELVLCVSFSVQSLGIYQKDTLILKPILHTWISKGCPWIPILRSIMQEPSVTNNVGNMSKPSARHNFKIILIPVCTSTLSWTDRSPEHFPYARNKIIHQSPEITSEISSTNKE